MSKEYFRNYYELHKDDWYKKIQCDSCNGIYCRASKHKHMQTQKHINAVKYKELEKKFSELNTKIINIKENLI